MRLIERKFYLDKLINVIGTPDIKVITGVRRSGKIKLLSSQCHLFKKSLVRVDRKSASMHFSPECRLAL